MGREGAGGGGWERAFDRSLLLLSLTCRLGTPGISGCSARVKFFSANRTPSVHGGSGCEGGGGGVSDGRREKKRAADCRGRRRNALAPIGRQPLLSPHSPLNRCLYTSRRFFLGMSMVFLNECCCAWREERGDEVFFGGGGVQTRRTKSSTLWEGR